MKSSRNTARQLFGLTVTLVGLLSWHILPIPHPELAVQAANRLRGAEPTGQTVSTAVANGRIVFISSEGGARADIYTMEADGSNVQRLTNNPAYDQSPKWSPDGRKIAFISSRDDTSVGCTSGGGCKNEIYVMNADGTNQTRTNNPGFDDDFDWSPDSTRIVFVSSHDGSIGSLSVMNADGSNVQRLTNYPGYDYSPKWSPDGTKIAFVRTDDYWDGVHHISVMNADGTNQTPFNSNQPGYEWDPRWSPDGTKIVFVSAGDASQSSHEIYVMNTDRSIVRRLTNNLTGEGVPRWSLDGTKIAFIRACQNNSCPSQQPPHLWVFNADGSNPTKLTDTQAWSHAWSPDGTKIIFGGPGSGGADVFVINLDGSGLTNITNTSGKYEWSPSWQPLVSAACPNPIDCADFFVRQHYLDFLNRAPEPIGAADWQAILNNCLPGDTSCDRIHVSSAFFRSPEFQERGYFVYRFYSVSLGRKPDFAEFMPDLSRVSGFLTPVELEAVKVAFVNDFMTRSGFVSRYNGLNDTQYVDALLATAGVTLSNRQMLIDALNAGTKTRGQVLREIVESTEVYNKHYNQAFVVMQYFGYLRRQPDALYLNWIAHLDATGDYRSMIHGFINSIEYRARFGP